MMKLAAWSLTRSLLMAAGVVAIAAVVLMLMGRIPICKCGYFKLWHGVVASSENSQHLSDWYTFSHIIHGFGFYWMLWAIGRRYGWPVGLRLVLAVVIESAWEILENTPLIIDRYRAVTIAFDYFGDSVINSVSDIVAMVVGFLAASRFPVWLTIVLLVMMEVVVGYWIRDNLTLNIIQLIHPFDAILKWQQAG